MGPVGAGGLPIPHGGQPPALGFIGEAADQHPQQPGPTSCRSRFQLQLHQQRAALQAGAPTGEMEGEIQALRLGEFAGEGIVAPGAEIGAGIGEVPRNRAATEAIAWATSKDWAWSEAFMPFSLSRTLDR